MMTCTCSEWKAMDMTESQSDDEEEEPTLADITSTVQEETILQKFQLQMVVNLLSMMSRSHLSLLFMA